MGFLDEVKRQQGKHSDNDAADASAKRSANSKSTATPGLELVHDGLSAYTKRMNAAMPNRSTDFAIHSYATLSGLGQSTFHCSTGADGSIHFGVDYKGRDGVQFETDNRKSCDELLDLLIGCGLKVSYRSHADWRFVFNVSPFVPVSITLIPLKGEPAVQVVTCNLESLGKRSERVDLERIDEHFLAELKKCFQLEPNRFRELCGNEVSDDVRAKLQARVAARQERRTAAKVRPETAQPAKGIRSLFGRWGGKK